MMYRCGWASKKNQERVLAVTISRAGFEQILANAYTVGVRFKSNHTLTVLLESFTFQNLCKYIVVVSVNSLNNAAITRAVI